MAERIVPNVIVIESPAPLDILNDVVEGKAICSALKLGGIKSSYYSVINLEALSNVFSLISKDICSQVWRTIEGDEEEINFAPLFHISAHGDENGFFLTSGELVTWENFGQLLVEFAKKTGHAGEKFCCFALVFSTCNGAFAKKMLRFDDPKPCIYLIGANKTVSWSDSLTAYVTFYHLVLNKNIPAPDILPIMNQAAGLDNVFEFYKI